jgi:hypothetical protein
VNILAVNDAQRDTILAALRHYQAGLVENDDMLPDAVADIATDSDKHEPLGAHEVGLLCIGINGGALDVTGALIEALEPIAEHGLDGEPEPEDYDDTEGAYNNGYDVARWEDAEHANKALALLRATVFDTAVTEDFDADDSVSFTAGVGRLTPTPINAYTTLLRLVEVARDIEAFETGVAAGEGGAA